MNPKNDPNTARFWERFWSKVDRRSPDECWEWIGTRQSRHGYGRLRVDGGWFYAHRIMWSAAHGVIPTGGEICHRCDNPPCVNPAHLFIGTQADNVMDMLRKGRGALPPVARGAIHPSSKLTDEQVADVRRRYADGGVSHRDLAREFGVHRSTVRQWIVGMRRVS